MMNEFFEYLESKGVEEIRDLTAFVHNFLQDPSVFFDLTETERVGMEKKMDEALSFFKSNNSSR